jgi:DNA (cytosine-5)-methyltransferase 1
MLKAISLFSGIGGLDFGFEQAGFDTRVAIEVDRHACQSMRLNRRWEIIEDNITRVSSWELLTKGGLKPGEADILIGGLSSRSFSRSGSYVRSKVLRLDDPRADALTSYLRVLRDARPRAFLLQYIYNPANEGNEKALRYMSDGVAEINRETGENYAISWKIVSCVGYGVPQIQERVFVIGARNGRRFKFPEPQYGDPKRIRNDLFGTHEPYRTAWDALGDIDEPNDLHGLRLGGKWGDLLPTIPEGENYLRHTDRRGGSPLFGWRTRHWSFLLKLSKRLPSWTVQAQPGAAIGPFHWKNRRLTVQEMCRLQTFPDGLSILGSRSGMLRQIGNAVPSLIAEIFAREISEQLFDRPVATPLRLLPPQRSVVPPPEKPAALPAKYREYIRKQESCRVGGGEHKPLPRSSDGLPR